MLGAIIFSLKNYWNSNTVMQAWNYFYLYMICLPSTWLLLQKTYSWKAHVETPHTSNKKGDDIIRNVRNLEFTQTKALTLQTKVWLTLVIVLIWLNYSTACNGNDYASGLNACQELQGEAGLRKHSFWQCMLWYILGYLVRVLHALICI